MFFLTLLFGWLGLTVDFQHSPSPAAQDVTQTKHGGFIIINGSPDGAQPEQDISGQGVTQPKVGGYIIING